jgi:hypothetical protein
VIKAGVTVMEPEAESGPRPESDPKLTSGRTATESRYQFHWHHTGNVCRVVACGPAGAIEASLLFESGCGAPGKDPESRYRVEAVLAWALRELSEGGGARKRPG